eukprot:TRINITY_DN50629_c0_g1_i1.p1 TRINITY_DN50629_c0_g1~~TRINITY_DN50629_c0_g1_i1.p1  ORF type:complete len:810 (+),score=131.71 TRINITY_DN50629_c0_g1_i1:91-2520(+)
MPLFAPDGFSYEPYEHRLTQRAKAILSDLWSGSVPERDRPALNRWENGLRMSLRLGTPLKEPPYLRPPAVQGKGAAGKSDASGAGGGKGAGGYWGGGKGQPPQGVPVPLRAPPPRADDVQVSVNQCVQTILGSGRELSRGDIETVLSRGRVKQPGRPERRCGGPCALEACRKLVNAGAGQVDVKILSMMITCCHDTVEAEHILSEFPTVTPNEVTYSCVLHLCRTPAEATHWFGVMTGAGVVAHQYCWNILIHKYARASNAPGVRQALECMSQAGVDPNEVTENVVRYIAGLQAKEWISRARASACQAGAEERLKIVCDRLVDLASAHPEGVDLRQLEKVYADRYGEQQPLCDEGMPLHEWLQTLPETRLRLEGSGPDATLFPLERDDDVWSWQRQGSVDDLSVYDDDLSVYGDDDGQDSVGPSRCASCCASQGVQQPPAHAAGHGPAASPQRVPHVDVEEPFWKRDLKKYLVEDRKLPEQRADGINFELSESHSVFTVEDLRQVLQAYVKGALVLNVNPREGLMLKSYLRDVRPVHSPLREDPTTCSQSRNSREYFDDVPERARLSPKEQRAALRGRVEEQIRAAASEGRQLTSSDITAVVWDFPDCGADAMITACRRLVEAGATEVTVKSLTKMAEYCPLGEMEQLFAAFPEVTPNDWTLSTVLRYACSTADEAHHWWRLMIDRYGIEPTSHNWDCLIHKYVISRDIPGFRGQLREMAAAGVNPDECTRELISRLSGRAGVDRWVNDVWPDLQQQADGAPAPGPAAPPAAAPASSGSPGSAVWVAAGRPGRTTPPGRRHSGGPQVAG